MKKRKYLSILAALPRRFLLMLNFLTTILQITMCLFLLAVLFVLIVSLISGTEDQLGSLVSPVDPPRKWLLITNSTLFALSVLVATIRWFGRNWIAHLSKEKGGKRYLLTWRKLRETKIRRAIIQGMWGVFQVIWVSLILAVVLPLASDLLHDKPEETINTTIVKFIRWVLFGPNLSQRLVLSAIVTFIFLSLIVRLLARNLPKEESIVSVKELEPVHKALDAVSMELQERQLQEMSRQVMEYADKQFVNELLEKDDRQELEKQIQQLKQRLEEEKRSRQEGVEKQVLHLLHNLHASSVPANPRTQPQTTFPPKLVK